MPKWKPLKGMKFGKLTVLEDYRDETKGKGHTHWCKCICDCGNKEIVNVYAGNLVRRHKISCGKCIYIKHGMTDTRFYSIYKHLYRRCNDTDNDRYFQYGGRGIKCLWKTFEAFKEDMYESYLEHFNEHNGDTTIDRIDVDGDYCKEICRWLTNREQQANKKCTQSIEENGVLYSIKWYCEEHNISYNKIRKIAKNNDFTLKDALFLYLGESA